MITARRSRHGRIRSDSWFGVMDYDAFCANRASELESQLTTWRLGPLSVVRDISPRYCMGHAVNDDGEEEHIWSEAKTTWKVEFGWRFS